MAKSQVVEQFGDRSGVAHPHEYACDTSKFKHVVRLKCSCGFDGLALYDDKTGKAVCPADEARKKQAVMEELSATNSIVTDNNSNAIQDMINKAVKEALAAQAASTGGK